MTNEEYKQRLLEKASPQDYDLFFSAEVHCFLSSEGCEFCPGSKFPSVRCNSKADFLCDAFNCDECKVECLGKPAAVWLQEALDKCEEVGLWE